ncbi:hypothetical protein [Arthrobacter sp. TS-15]|uniref:hypothetical protein n=1 Tax=Arthrobacter sp. TS-15 TaxID=2510797 RepID=UPI001EE88DDD|nr:hypothetical protein [Arthrobacter sp. TS-15]
MNADTDARHRPPSWFWQFITPPLWNNWQWNLPQEIQPSPGLRLRRQNPTHMGQMYGFVSESLKQWQTFD